MTRAWPEGGRPTARLAVNRSFKPGGHCLVERGGRFGHEPG